MHYLRPRRERHSYLFLQLILSVLFICIGDESVASVAWLSSQANPDGSYGQQSSIASSYQATTESIITFYSLGESGNTTIPTAVNYTNNELYNSTENLTRKIIVNALNGNEISNFSQQIISAQNEDGGYGELHAYDSTIIDTAYAIQALAYANKRTTDIASYAVAYLLNKQLQDGSFADGGNQSSLFLTALVSHSLQYYIGIYNVTGAITRANQYLLSNLTTTGNIGELHESALSLIAIAPVTYDKTIYQPLVSYLENSRSPDTSWNGDAYQTALALRAVYLADNLTAPNPELGNLKGIVTDQRTGAVLAGVTITVTGSTNQSTKTDAEGRYSITDIPAGNINITANLTGYYQESVTATVDTAAQLVFSPALMKNPEQAKLIITGIIIDQENNIPIENVSVQLSSTAVSTSTNNSGLFNLTDITPGIYTLTVNLAGYLPATYTVSAPSGGVVDLGIILLKPESATTPATGTVKGHITDSASSLPLQGVTVSITGTEDRTVFTDANGNFVINDVVPGHVSVTASLEGYHPASGSGELVAGAEINFSASLIKRSEAGLATVKGKLVDKDTGQPLEGALVSVLELSQTITTDNVGEFQLNGIVGGTYIIQLSMQGYVTLTYSVTLPDGGIADLGVVSLSLDVPITPNRSPEITSTPPGSITVGQTYIYQPVANDPDGDILTFNVTGAPAGLEINQQTGRMAWIPTLAEVGTVNFSLIVSDDKGAINEQPIVIQVATGSNRSYVITDVETLGGIALDEIVPNNYSLATYLTGAVPNFVSASPPCPLSWSPGGSDVPHAVSQLDRLAVQPSPDNDLILDLGAARSSLTVFPQIDHGPFPQEGIEYTVWGSNDPGAVFPDGWELATLVAIYKKGWTDDPTCTGDETDDYAGLYTFGLNSYQYVRVRADYSISIFNDPTHTTWNSQGDDSSVEGWQSLEAEIDAVGGMVCTANPIADAGPDITGLVREPVTFDGINSQGDILLYGWDIDGDNELDVTGPNPQWTFNGGFDGNVKLLVVDSNGCVGTDEVHVLVDLDLPKPDLSVSDLSTNGATTDLNTLQITGNANLIIRNNGNAPLLNTPLVTVFDDINLNEQYDSGIDTNLGTISMPHGLDRGQTLSMTVPLNGQISFRDKTLHAFVDSGYLVEESNEENNINSTGYLCQIEPLPAGSLNPVEKWQWNWSNSRSSLYRQVMSSPVVAQLNDDNGDGEINNNDMADIIFTTFRQSSYTRDGILRAISGADGTDVWSQSLPLQVAASAGTPAVGDIDGDGLIEIVVGGPNWRDIYVYENDGTLKWNRPYGGQVHPALADVDNNGTVEIIFGARIFDADGNELYSIPSSDSIQNVFDADLDGDLEIFGNGKLSDHQGNLLWTSPVGGRWGAVGNFDDDQYPEIAVRLGNDIALLEHTGEVKWGPVPVPGGGGGPITIADVDGDGEPEIGVAGGNYYIVFETNGSVKWQSPTRDRSSRATGSTVFDFEGDGKAEILYNDELYFRVYDGSTGEVLVQIRNSSGTLVEYPLVADIDNDQHAEIILAANNYAFGGVTGIRVFENQNDDWMPTRSIWNQHTYHINNVNDDGSIPQYEQPSWLSHNTYRLNTFTDRNPLDQVDLSASLLQYVEEGVNTRLSVRIGNGGTGRSPTGVTLRFSKEENNVTETLAEIPVDPLQPGEYRDVVLDNLPGLNVTTTLTVFVDAANLVPECNETNNVVSLPVKVQGASGALTVGTDKQVYAPESPVILAANITNNSSLPAEYRVKLQVMDLQNKVLAVFGPESVGQLEGQDAIVLNKDWFTAQYVAGRYVLHGTLYNTSGQVLAEGTSQFEIHHSDGSGPVLSLRVTTDKPLYHTTDTVQIESLIQNQSVSTIIPDAVLHLSVKSATGQEVFAASISQGQLIAGTSVKGYEPYEYRGIEAGVYQVDGELRDSQGNVFASGNTPFEVVEDPRKALTAEIKAERKRLYQGESQLCTSTINNTGIGDWPSLQLKQNLVQVESQAVVISKQTTVSIAAGASQTLLQGLETKSLTPDNYACLLVATIDGVDTTLAYDAFILDPPPIVIDSALTQGMYGRLLVLLDEEKKHHHKHKHDNERDRHGPKDAPSLTEQRAFLEEILERDGWSYLIVTEEDEFVREFRTGNYSVVALLSEHHKLDEEVQKELRESVYRGNGLVVAGTHDDRNHGLDAALGIKVKGKESKASSLTLHATPLSDEAEQSLGYKDKVLRIEVNSAEIAAVFTSVYHHTSHDDDHNHKHDKEYKHAKYSTEAPAITYNTYGNGRTVFAGFDLLAHATATGDASLFDELFSKSVEYTQPDGIVPLAGRVVPVALLLTNQGIATPGQVIITLPDGSSIVDPGDAIAGINNTLIWAFDLTEDQVLQLDFWLQLPNDTATVTINALIQTGEVPDFADYDSVALAITPQVLPGLDEAQARLADLAHEHDFKKALKYLNKAIAAREQQDYKKALALLLKVTDKLMKQGGAEAHEIRLLVDNAIAEMARLVPPDEKHGKHKDYHDDDHDWDDDDRDTDREDKHHDDHNKDKNHKK